MSMLAVLGNPLLLFLKHRHVKAVTAEASAIRQALETNREIDDKLIRNPENPFK